jgi:hypothetical protein
LKNRHCHDRSELQPSPLGVLVDGYLAGLEPEKLAKATQVTNSGFNAPILDIGF